MPGPIVWRYGSRPDKESPPDGSGGLRPVLRRPGGPGVGSGDYLRRRARTIRPVSPLARMPIAAHSPGSGTAALVS